MEILWLDKKKDYFNKLISDTKNIPVLHPQDIVRKKEREEILRWLLQLTDENLTTSISDADVIVSFSRKFDTLAESYAKRQNRRFYCISTQKELALLRKKNDMDSLLIIGEYPQFRYSDISYYLECLNIPIGILTAPNHEILSFVIAKALILQKITPNDRKLVNAIYESCELHNFPECSIYDIKESEMSDILLKGQKNLAIYSHGGGTHVNLHTHVLCGLITSYEIEYINEPLIKECGKLPNGKRYCRRVFKEDIHILSHNEIKAARLNIYSCSSFNTEFENHTTNLGSIYSLALGYSCSSILGASIIKGGDSFYIIAEKMLSDGISPGWVVNFLNDAHYFNFQSRPYILFGDPSGEKPQFVMSDLISSDSPYQQLMMLKLKDNNYKVIDIGDDSLTHAIRSERNLAFISSISKEIYLKDRTDEWEYLNKRISEIYTNIHFFYYIFENLYTYERYILNSSSTNSLDVCIKFIENIRNYKQSLLIAKGELEWILREGIWNTILDTYRVQIDEMYLSFINQIREILFYEFSINILINGCMYAFRKINTCSSGEKCFCCTNTLILQTFQSSFYSGITISLLYCPECGEQELFYEGRSRYGILRNRLLHVGDKLQLRLISESNIDNIKADVFVHFTDKGTGAVIYNEKMEIEVIKNGIEIEFIHAVSPNNHTLRLVIVGEFGIQLFRHKIPLII